jgi:hypothetical protein
MKKIISLAVSGILALTLSVTAQQIKNISITANPPSYSGSCPAKITFTATIQYSGSGTLQYTWLRSDNAHAPTRTLKLDGSGTQIVTTTWQLGKSFQGWQAVKVTSPVTYESGHAEFSLACNGTKAATPNPPVTVPNTASTPNNPTRGPVASPSKANIPVPLQIQNAQLTVDKSNYSGKCPVGISFRATIHYTGKGTIRYTWVTSDGGSNGTITKQLSGSGTEILQPHIWQLGRTFSGSVSLKITSPVQYQSSPVSFQVNCH